MLIKPEDEIEFPEIKPDKPPIEWGEVAPHVIIVGLCLFGAYLAGVFVRLVFQALMKYVYGG